MEFFNQILHEHKSDLIASLESCGFSKDLANDFLYEIAASLSTTNPQLDIPGAIKQLMSEDPVQILNSIERASFAKNLGITASRAALGIRALQPRLSSFMALKKDDILNTIIDLSWGPYGQPTSLVKQIFN